MRTLEAHVLKPHIRAGLVEQHARVAADGQDCVSDCRGGAGDAGDDAAGRSEVAVRAATALSARRGRAVREDGTVFMEDDGPALGGGVQGLVGEDDVLPGGAAAEATAELPNIKDLVRTLNARPSRVRTLCHELA